MKTRLNKKFWLRIQEKFLANEEWDYLCHASKEFEKLWENDKEFQSKVKKLADSFLRKGGLRDLCTSEENINGECLFYLVPVKNYESICYEDRTIRRMFLEWAVENSK